MSDKFTYTADDAAGCILKRPNYEQCKDCVYNYNEEPFHCLIFEDFKPAAIIYDGKKCKDKRTE